MMIAPRTCLYEGWVQHRRHTPVRNEFRYRLFMLYIDLRDLPTLFDGVPLWSARRPAPAWFRRRDYHGPADLPLDEAVRATVARVTGRRPSGPIRLLTHLRYWGFIFNPVSFYYIYDAADTKVETILAEITNMPWLERRAIVLDQRHDEGQGGALRFRFLKDFHVSPFMPMDVTYDWRFTEPGSTCIVHMKNIHQGSVMFDATLSLRRRAWTRAALLGCLLRFPVMTLRIAAAIHYQALRLWLKRATFYSHPKYRPDVRARHCPGAAPPAFTTPETSATPDTDAR